MVSETKKVSSYREERVRSSSVGPSSNKPGYGNTLERIKTSGRNPDWNRHLDQLLDELQTSINHPSSLQRSDGISPGSLYGALTTPSSPSTALTTLTTNGFGPSDNDKITSHVREEYTSPDKKKHTFKESYDFHGSGGGPESNVTRHGTVSFYSSRFEDGGPTSIKRSGSLRDRSPDRFLESASLLREMRQRDTSGFDTIGRCRSPESYVNTSTPYSTVKSGYNKSHRTHSESGDHYQLIDSARHKYSPSDPSYTPKTPKRSASLDRRPSFERNYNNSMNRDGSTWRAREGSWPRYTDTVSSKNSNTSTWKTRTHQSYNYMEGDTPERRSRRDDRSVSPVQSRSGSLRRDASPIRPGYGGEDQDPRYNTYASNNTYATIERESRTRTRGGSGGGGGGGSHETHSHHHHRRDDSGSGSESRSRSPSTSRHRHGRQRDASPIMPGYGTDADPSKIVRSYNYQYMGDGSGSRSPSPNSIRRYFSQKSIEEKHREPSRHKIKYVRKEPERPPTPLGERIYPKNITNSDVGSQRPPKQVDELMASFSGQQLHEYRNVGPGLSQIRSSTPKPEKKVEIDETRIVVKHTDNNISDEQKKIVPSKAGPAVYYPPGFESTLQKREEGKAVPLWMSGEAEMSRGSYKYKSRSKSKEKKGAVAVPVCLPVCCAAPLCCSVM